jgi:hypothetical protein
METGCEGMGMSKPLSRAASIAMVGPDDKTKQAALWAKQVMEFDTLADFLADETVLYSRGDFPVEPGDMLKIAGNWVEVAEADDASPAHTSAGGMKVLEAGPSFSTRARAAAWIARGGTAADGTVISWPGGSVVAETGATAISDMAGWVPFGTNVLSPVYWGVDNTGATDEYAKLQAMIDYAYSSGMKDIIFPPGTYKFNTALDINGGKLRICAIPGTVDLAVGTYNQNHINIGDGTSDSRRLGPFLYGMNFIADSSLTTAFTSGRCINIDYQYGAEIRECTFYGDVGGTNVLWDALYINEGQLVRSLDCRFEHMANRGYVTTGTATGSGRSVDCKLIRAYIKDCEGYSIEIGPYTEAAFLDDFAITQSGDTPLYINSNPSTENGFLHIIRRPNIESSAGITTGIDIVNGKQVSIEGGWVGKFTNSVRFRSGCTLSTIRDTLVNGRILVEGANNTIDCDISDSSPDGAAGVYITATGDGTQIRGSVRSFTGGGVDVSSGPERVMIGPISFSSITGNYIVGGNYSGGPHVVGVSTEIQNTGGASVSAASTIDLKIGRDFFQVTGATTISNINIYHPERRITIQAGSGGITFDALGNVRGVTTVSAFSTVTLMCDHQTWFAQ